MLKIYGKSLSMRTGLGCDGLLRKMLILNWLGLMKMLKQSRSMLH